MSNAVFESARRVDGGRAAGGVLPPRPREDAGLASVRAKVMAGERLSLADGERLLTTPDIWTVCELADLVRRRLHGDVAYYNINRHLNYSNVCALSCKFCEFYRKQGEEGAYTRDMGYVREQVARAVEAGATEMHVVGGLSPYLPWSYYPELVATICDEAEKRAAAEEVRSEERGVGSGRGAGGGIDANGKTGVQRNLTGEEPAKGSTLPLPPPSGRGRMHVKAFTAVEIVHLAKIAKVYRNDDRAAGIRWVLNELKQAGLGSLPGGGAEVFDDRVHDAAFKGKIRSDVWLDVHRVAHELGLNSNATILYGHVERPEDRLVHMEMLRRAQDRALARMGYRGEATRQQGIGASGSGSDAGGHLGYSGDEGAEVPAITLTREGVELPERVRFGSGGGGWGGGSESRHLGGASGYFQTIIPLPFFPDGSELEHLPGPGGLENLRTLAVSRLMLDNFPHVKAFWIMQTLPMAHLMLQAGADDIDGTVVWYDITKVPASAGAEKVETAATHQEVTVGTLQKAIRDAGFKPVERDTLYREVKREGKRWWV